MNIIILSLAAALFVSMHTPAHAEKTRDIERRIQTAPGKKIQLSNFSGANISFKGWDKQEIYCKFTVKISASDSEKEAAYMDSVRIVESETGDVLQVRLSTGERGSSSNTWNFFGMEFGSYFKKEITGEVYLPQGNPAVADVRYGNYSFDGLKGEVSINGKSNNISIGNCTQLKSIVNDYGNLTLKNSAGNTTLSARSSSVDINNFKGIINAEMNYSTVGLHSVHGAGDKAHQITMKSGSMEAENITGKLSLDAPYSAIELTNLNGDLKMDARSSKIDLENINGNIQCTADYSKTEMKNISASTLEINGRSSAMEISFKTVPKNLSAIGDYSTIEVEMPAGFAGNVNLETQYGSIDTNFSITNKSAIKINGSESRQVVNGTVGSGNGQINIKSRSGSISLMQK